jgi:hypothetical protein
MRIPGVLNLYSIEINSVADDLAISDTQIARPGTTSVTVL